MLKQAQIAVVLRDLREKKDSLDNVIELLEKTYNLKGIGEVEQEFEDLAASAQENIGKPWSRKNGNNPTLGDMVLNVIHPNTGYRASDVRELIGKKYLVDAKLQSIAAQLSQYYNKGILSRPEKGIYELKGGGK